jgi:hypothetical protein
VLGTRRHRVMFRNCIHHSIFDASAVVSGTHWHGNCTVSRLSLRLRSEILPRRLHAAATDSSDINCNKPGLPLVSDAQQ